MIGPSVLPQGDIVWEQILAEDFSVDAAPGYLWHSYPEMVTYDGFRDTSKLGTYLASNFSVHDGMLDAFIHSDPAGPTSSAIWPLGWDGQMYGKYTWSQHMDWVPGFNFVPMLWSPDNNWKAGEWDLIENEIGTPKTPVRINLHESTGDPRISHGTSVPGVYLSDPHVVDVEWTPKFFKETIDGNIVRYTENRIIMPTGPMRFGFQMEVNPTKPVKVPPPSSAGHVYIDWIAAYAYGGLVPNDARPHPVRQ